MPNESEMKYDEIEHSNESVFHEELRIDGFGSDNETTSNFDGNNDDTFDGDEDRDEDGDGDDDGDGDEDEEDAVSDADYQDDQIDSGNFEYKTSFPSQDTLDHFSDFIFQMIHLKMMARLLMMLMSTHRKNHIEKKTWKLSSRNENGADHENTEHHKKQKMPKNAKRKIGERAKFTSVHIV